MIDFAPLLRRQGKMQDPYVDAALDYSEIIASAVVFEDIEDYHARIEDPGLGIDERTILVIRGVGVIGSSHGYGASSQ